MIKKNIFFVVILLSNSIIAQTVKHLSESKNQIFGTVNTIEKDSLGYLWIGTSQGVKKYNGSQFKTYNTSDKGISKIFHHDNHLYLISNEGAVYNYNYLKDRLEIIIDFEKDQLLSAVSLNKNEILLGLNNGFIILNPQTKSIKKLFEKQVVLYRDLIFHNNKVFAASPIGVEIFVYDAIQKSLKKETTLLKGKDIIDIAFDKENRLWVGTETEGLFIFKNGMLKKIAITDKYNKKNAIRKIAFTSKKESLVAVDRLGLYKIDRDFNITKNYKNNPDNNNTISQNSIYEIFVDSKNTYWLGLREGGIDLIHEKDNVFKNIQHIKNEKNSISNNDIRAIFESKDGSLWFGTENGISQLDNDGKWTNFNSRKDLYNTAILAINEVKNELLLGTYGQGILKFNQQTKKTSKYEIDQLSAKFIFRINTYTDGLWVDGADTPLTYFRKEKFHSNYNVGLVRALVKGYDGIYYIGSKRGLFEVNTRNSSVRHLLQNDFNKANEVFTLNLDHRNNCIWIGTKKGLYKFHLSSDKLSTPKDLKGNNTGTVFSIEKDNLQNLYLATINGLWSYDIKKQLLKKYGPEDGLTINQFGIGASAKLKDGNIVFGGSKGAVIFDPLYIEKDISLKQVFLNNFKINGKPADSITLPNSINFTEEISLRYDQNTVSFNIETIKLNGSSNNRFEWKLNGLDEDFNSSTEDKTITYSNLKPGKYHLNIKAYNADGIACKKERNLEITIHKPFWNTPWAYLLYIFFTALLFFLITKIVKANTQKRFDESRIKFFVEVAHDIRTPVSLIQLLVKQLANQENVQKSMELIQKNAQNLNEYVTQLLDFQKITRNQLKLSISKVDLKSCLENIIEDFSPLLKEKTIQIKLDVKHIPVWFDEAKMTRIFYNLISNAIKYTPENGEITIKASLENELQISFIDNGIGIPEKQQDLIFNRFTRGTNVSNKGIPGTGIGLMLSKKIVELHGGKITLDSKENVGSKFTVVLPKDSAKYEKNNFIKEVIQEEESDQKVDNLIQKNKTILLVEDTEDLRKTIKLELSKNFKVIEASNGKEGLLLALSKSPDLIITDVMMPKMDGKEMCQLIKTNFKTSHIPVIMLTALTNVDEKIKGLEHGADAYIEKPFNIDILNATINNLIKSRNNIKNLFEDKKVEKKLTPDESFLSDVIEVIKENMTSKDFSIDVLCELMGLSRSNLFRKLKALVQMSPSDLIIKIKLSHAEELMKSKRITRISDIAYESGFQDPKYFSTLFKKHYGKTPKEFIEAN